MSGLGHNGPQEASTRLMDRGVKGPDWTVLCSFLTAAVAVITVCFMARKETAVCCNIAEELNMTKKLTELEIRLKDIKSALEKANTGGTTHGRCRPGWIHFSNSCYYFSKEKDTWPMALLKCIDIGGYLVEINDAAENSFFKETAKLLGNYVWMGGSDQLKESDWIWVTSGTHFSVGVYTDWHPTQPDNSNGKEHCLHFNLNSYQWNDVLCSELFNYACETVSAAG